MRVFLTTTIATADRVCRDGFTNMHQLSDVEGVYLADAQLDANDGFEGPVTLCLDVPDDVFQKYEWVEDGLGYRHAVIPAEVLNRLPRPQVYDHLFAGCSRRQMVQAIRRREHAGSVGYPSVQDMRDAMAFFDRIGWLTPVRLSEGGE
jgi:hypothetical protein